MRTLSAGFLLALAPLTGCGDKEETDTSTVEADTDTDTDTDTDADTDADADTDTDTDTDTTPVTFNADVAPILATNCTDYGCHLLEGSPNALNIEVAYTNLLTEPSEDIPSMARVSPGAPDDSYLWHKVAGTHTTLDEGRGDQMPKGYAPLSSSELATIEAWILGGALEE